MGEKEGQKRFGFNSVYLESMLNAFLLVSARKTEMKSLGRAKRWQSTAGTQQK